MKFIPPLPNSIQFVMAGLVPATHRARVCGRIRVSRRVDTRRMGGRLKGGHDGFLRASHWFFLKWRERHFRRRL